MLRSAASLKLGFRPFAVRYVQHKASSSNDDSSGTADRSSLASKIRHLFAKSDRDDKELSGTGVSRLLSLARPESRLIGGAMAFLVVGTGTSLAFPSLMGRLVDVATHTNDGALYGFNINEISAGLLGVFVVGGVATFGRTLCLQVAGERVIRRLRSRLFSNLLRQEMAFYDTVKVGEMINRLSTDTMVISKSITDKLSQGIRMIAQGVGALALLTTISPSLTASMMLVIPPASLTAVVFGRYVKRKQKQLLSRAAVTTEVAEEKLNAIATVRSFMAESREAGVYSARVQKVYKTAVDLAMANASFSGVSQVMMSSAVLSVLWRGSALVEAGQMTVGELSSFLLYSTYMAFSVSGATRFYTDLMTGVGASARVFSLIDRTPSRPVAQQSASDFEFRGKVEFKNVSFNYPSRPDSPVLKNLSFTLDPGQSVAIVGGSGSGKSSILKLLQQFYEPDEGEILVDGVNLKDTQGFLKNVGSVSQDVILFRSTIGDNIRYAKEDASEDDVIRAAKMANAHRFIQALPHNYDTPIASDSLSGGQRQRIGLARALLHNPSLVLLDEATSAQDVQSEAAVQESLDKMKQSGKSMIAVTHRLSTAKRADKILVLDGGAVAESGTHAELKAQQGLYFAFIQAQKLQKKQ